MRTIENQLVVTAERLHQVLENQSGSDVESRQRLIKDENVRIVHDRGDQENALAHSLRIRAHGRVSVRMQRKKLEQGINLLRQLGIPHPTQSSDHLEIFPSAQIRIEMSLLRHISQAFSISLQIILNVVTVELNRAARGLKQPGEHLYGCAFAGAVGPKASQDLSRPHREREILHSRQGRVALGKMHGFEHGVPLSPSR